MIEAREASHAEAEPPRVLVLGAGALHRGHYRSIRAMGCTSIGLDRDPEAPARDEADLFVPGDPSDPGRTLEVARAHDVRAILPLAEFGVVPAAMASRELGLIQVSPQAARTSHDKAATRRAWAARGIPQPAHRLVTNVEQVVLAGEEIGFPLVIKPTTSSGARGVRLVSDPEELRRCYPATSAVSGNEVLLEERVEGIETSVEGVVMNGGVTVLAYGDKQLRPHERYRVTRSINYPGDFSSKQIRSIRERASACVAALDLRNGPFHLEVFVRGDDVLPIECGARGGGGHIFSDIVRLVSGVDMVRLSLEILLGRRPRIPLPETRGACYRFLFPPPGRLEAVRGIEAALEDPRVVSIVVTARPGEELIEPHHGPGRPACVVTSGKDRLEAMRAADRVEETLEWSLL